MFSKPRERPTSGGTRGGRFSARDRVMLYLRGLEMDDMTSLELATECLRRTGENADPGRVMAELRVLLQERGVFFHLTDPSGRQLQSYPPINRRSMVSEGVDWFTLYGTAKKVMLRVFGFKPLENKVEKRRRA